MVLHRSRSLLKRPTQRNRGMKLEKMVRSFRRREKAINEEQRKKRGKKAKKDGLRSKRTGALLAVEIAGGGKMLRNSVI